VATKTEEEAGRNSTTFFADYEISTVFSI